VYRSLSDIYVILKDLTRLLVSQRDDIKMFAVYFIFIFIFYYSIDKNFDSTLDNMDESIVQLEKAQKKFKSKRRLIFRIFLVVILFLIVLGFIL
jgi:hypothetical protein